MTFAVTQELPSDKLALRIDSPSGQSARWAEDEVTLENVLGDLEFSDEMPGGYKDLQCVLPRDPRHHYNDIEAFGDIKVIQPGGNIVWAGSLDKAPDVSGDQLSISPSALGYQAILEDNQAAQIGIIDSDLSKFGDPSAQRLQNLHAIAVFLMASVIIGYQNAGTASPGVIFDWSNVEAVAGKIEAGEQIYYGEGVDLGKFLYDFVDLDGLGNVGIHTQAMLSSDDIATSNDIGTDHIGVTALQQSVTATASGRKYAFVKARHEAAYEGQMTNLLEYANIRVLGNHGMTAKGTWPNIGFSSKQILEYMIPAFASPLEIDPNYIDDDGYIIPQAWYGQAGAVANALKDVVKYALFDWFVYHGKRLEYRRPGTYGKFWKAYTAASDLNELGLDSQRLWRSIVVVYTDPNGNARTAGPIGSGCDTESGLLEITDPDHPAVRARRTRKDVLDLQGIGVPSTAIAVGQRFLEEANLINRSGSGTLSGYVLDNHGVRYPSACVKSGDWISFVDAADTGYRKIINKSYRHRERSAEIDLDAPASGLEALLERLQAGLLSLGVS